MTEMKEMTSVTGMKVRRPFTLIGRDGRGRGSVTRGALLPRDLVDPVTVVTGHGYDPVSSVLGSGFGPLTFLKDPASVGIKMGHKIKIKFYTQWTLERVEERSCDFRVEDPGVQVGKSLSLIKKKNTVVSVSTCLVLYILLHLVCLTTLDPVLFCLLFFMSSLYVISSPLFAFSFTVVDLSTVLLLVCLLHCVCETPTLTRSTHHDHDVVHFLLTPLLTNLFKNTVCRHTFNAG
jgi:hypothetical protein